MHFNPGYSIRKRTGIGVALCLFSILAHPLVLQSAGFLLANDSHLEWSREDAFSLISRGCGVTEITLENADLSGTVVAVDPGNEEVLPSGVRIAYDWGSLTLEWELDEGLAYGTFTLENTSEAVIGDFTLKLLELRISDSQAGTSGFEAFDIENLDSFAYHAWETQEVRISGGLLSKDPPLRLLAEEIPGDAGYIHWSVQLAGGVHRMEDGGVTLPILGSARLEPGQSLSARFLFKETATEQPGYLANAVFWSRLYEETNQPLNWPDRRPIGMLFLHSKFSESNPMGLFWDENLDAGDPEAVEAKASLYTQGAIEALTAVDAQGAIIWDLEGGFNTDIWYAGDPRMLPLLNPGMDAVADTVFSMIEDAGFLTGVTLRPTQVYFDEAKDQWRHGTGSHGPDRNPLEETYDTIWPEGMPWWRFFPIVERMDRKIQYAKDRWNCRLFYIDTNGIYREIDNPNPPFSFVLLNAAIIRELRERHPDILIIPEFTRTDTSGTYLAYWGTCVPYGELDLGSKGTASWIRNIYPEAFSAINITDGDIEGNRSQLVESVRAGDLLLFRGWFKDGRNTTVREIYEEAASTP